MNVYCTFFSQLCCFKSYKSVVDYSVTIAIFVVFIGLNVKHYLTIYTTSAWYSRHIGSERYS